MMENKVIRRSFSKAGFVALIVVLMQFAVAMILLPILFPDVDPATASPFLTTLLPIILSYMISVPIAWLILRKGEHQDQTPEKHKIPIGTLIAWFIAFFALARIVLLVITLIQTAIAGETVVDPVTNQQLNAPWMMLILATVVAPIVEELIFRGFFYKALAPYGGKWYILISALLFGLFHTNVTQIPFAFVLGLFFAYVMYRTGNVLIPMLLHFITNLISSVNMLFVGSESGMVIVVLITFGLMIAGVVVGIVLLAKKRVKKDIVFEPATVVPAKAGQVFINVGMIVSILVLIGFTILVATM